ncbi:MAG TPA: multicopper oxidase family protein [Dongiaceae bacterium]|jgi:FtsP/CotA-like multicopper oxidase with cupredoxin domain|nr:multicopper oxidase family protein [Dongiaceae bacterium]
MKRYNNGISRRALLASGCALTAALGLPFARPLAKPSLRRLRASPVQVPLRGQGVLTKMWGYNGTVPGPVLRFRQGATAHIEFVNDLPQPSTVHWHGVRVPIAMDGVPDISQPLVQPGQKFDYVFDLPDAGTFWYHPHHSSREQLGRGLSGVLIVDEVAPPKVDRDIVWQLNDWRLVENGQIKPDFQNALDAEHDGRFGNLVTINGRKPTPSKVRAGERWRLRLVNTANARIMSLIFEGHEPWIIALDGNPVTPHHPDENIIDLSPGQRADLILDMSGRPGGTFAVRDVSSSVPPYVLTSLAYSTETPLRGSPLEASIALPANPLPPLDLGNAVRQKVVVGGGTMGEHGSGPEAETAPSGATFWTINGVAARDHHVAPMFAIARGRTVILEVKNGTLWNHPVHLHGFPFQVMTRNGKPTAYREWRDTELLRSNDMVELAFTADRPGDWMFHCHILDHQETGMMTVIRVT